MFREEREKIVHRGEECTKLFAATGKILDDIKSLSDLYRFISPRSSQLHSECKDIVTERSDLQKSYERINSTLGKKEELRSLFRRMPEIKNQIISTLNLVFQDYQKRQEPEGTPLDEYYGRFFTECRSIRESTSQLESCLLSPNTDELLLYLEEIYTLYFDLREQLIEPVFSKSLRGLISRSDRNYCDLLRQSTGCLARLLRNEVQLFNKIFSSPLKIDVKQQALTGYLELLCRIFYEHLRPVIIHVHHLETLAELYKLVTETMKTEVLEECYQMTMRALAQDIQERMTFRAEVFIQESVLDYKPSQGDLAYPEKLEIVIGGELKDFQSMWYPTVQRTVLALSYLNRVFDPLTFGELAQEIVCACFKSLDLAHKLIDERHGGTKLEATLFLSKHLAIIKDQMQSYNINLQTYSPGHTHSPSLEMWIGYGQEAGAGNHNKSIL